MPKTAFQGTPSAALQIKFRCDPQSTTEGTVILATAQICDVMFLAFTFSRCLRTALLAQTTSAQCPVIQTSLDKDAVMKVFGILCLLAAAFLSCVAGVYAVTNTPVALAVAITACFALVAGVKWISDRR